jgi:hypothetical protein
MPTKFDFNEAPEQRNFDVIPERTIAVLQLNIRPGDAGEDGMLTRSKDGRSIGLDCEFIVTEGPHAKRKFWARLTLSGTTEGHAEAARISQGVLRAILESARGIKPSDVSEAAKKARIAEYYEFNGIRFIGEIGVESAKNGYKAKNYLAKVVTPDRDKDWHPVEQTKPSGSGDSSTGNIVKPEWAK